MNVTHLLTVDESALLEAYRCCCTMHREGVLMVADTAADRCAAGSAELSSGCVHSVAPVEDLASVLARRGFEERRAAEAAAEKWQQLARRNKQAARPRPGPTRQRLILVPAP